MGPATHLSAALGALDDDEAADRLLDLLGGDSNNRRWAAHVARRLNRSQDVGLLATLIQDPAPEVRAAAAEGLASLVAGEHGGPLAADALRRCAGDPGTRAPAHAAAALALAESRSSTADEVLAELQRHISAQVRAQARRTRGE
jgi:HEAT repeat protein